jgi:hypothetical protein
MLVSLGISVGGRVDYNKDEVKRLPHI